MYASEQDIIDTYGADALLLAADRDNDGVADVGVAAKALTDASELIDSYLGAKYSLPLATVPPALNAACVDITMYKLSSAPGAMTEEIRERYRDTLRWLERLAEGKVSLGLDSAQTPPSSSGMAETSGPERVFSRKSMKGW